MLNLLKALRQDEHGVILSAELVIVGTVLVIGVMTGMACLQKSVNGELGDLAKAIDSIDQTYSFSGHQKAGRFNGNGDCCAFTAGSSFLNNECNPNVCKSDIVGFEGQVMLHSGGNGACGSCGGRCGAGGFCGTCGGRGYGYRDPNRPNCVSTGVPNMKVTEYPGTSNVPRTSNEGRSPIRFPELENQAYPGQFGTPAAHSFDDATDLIPDEQCVDSLPPAIPELPAPLHNGGPHDRRHDQNESPAANAQNSASTEPDAADENTPLRPIPERNPLPAPPLPADDLK
ncbi:MAG: hypothetical protein KDB01_03535 [Planctomycetaceae bacterium]|nr:hypothetical protein [Planctomycetaceae bacterium]